MDNSTFEKIISEIKPGQEFRLKYKKVIPCSAPFKKLSGNWHVEKITDVVTVTGINYSELDSVKQARADRAEAEKAALDAGEEIAPKKEFKSFADTVIPHMVTKNKVHGGLYLLVYPKTCWKNYSKVFNLVDENGEIKSSYDNADDIKDFITQGKYDDLKNSKGGDIANITVDNIFELQPLNTNESINEVVEDTIVENKAD